MTVHGEFAPSPTDWVREQVEQIEAAGDTAAVAMKGLQVVLLTMRGASSGKVRKVPLMRVEHAGRYAAVASQGGAPKHPQWYHNLLAHPDTSIEVADRTLEVHAVELQGAERDRLFNQQASLYPGFEGYQRKTNRVIPVVALVPTESTT